MVRTKVNSRTLQEKFPKIYEQLFSQCMVVVSSGDTLFWSGEYVRFFGGLAILQKLPVKVFVGLELVAEPKVSFADHLYGYAPYQDRFIDLTMEQAKEKRLLDFLNKYVQTFSIKMGFKIHLLSEAHCGGGLGTTGVVLTCLAAAILILFEQITPQELEQINQKSLQEQIQDPNSPFNKIFRLAWKLTAICRGGFSSGATSFGAMLATNQPIVFVSEGSDCVKDHPTVIDWKDPLENCKVFEQIAYWGAPLATVFGLREPLTWPVDIARIWSGSMVNTEHILKSISHIQRELEETRKFILKPLAKNLNFEQTKDKPFFYHDAQKVHKNGFWHGYVELLNLTSIRILESLAAIFKQGSAEDALRDFFAALAANHRLTQYLGTSTEVLDTICRNLIKEGSRVNESVGCGAKMEGIGKGGHVVFVFPTGDLQDRIDNLIKKLAREVNKDIWLDWASWMDGWGADGIKLEQSIASKIHSSFIAPDSIRISHWRSNKLLKNVIVSRQNFEKIIQASPLVLDKTENKIYLQGQALTSKEIFSASGTIAILTSLLKTKEAHIKNKDMPSAYSHNRYDLQSKIIIPLQKIVKKKLNKELEFAIHGGMYDQYSLSLLPNDLEIILAEPLMLKK